MEDHSLGGAFGAQHFENGRVGVRNHVLLLPLDDLSNAACEAVANNVKGTLKVKEPKPSKLDLFNAALAAADDAPTGQAVTQKKKKAPKADDTAEAPAEEAAAEAPAAE